MPRDEIHTCYVCVYVNCAKWGGRMLLAGLTERLAGTSVRVKAYLCFGACPTGPNIVLYPRGTWYENVDDGDLDNIAAHIGGGETVTRRLRDVDPDTLRMALWMVDAEPD